jgi:hypothetical protein
MLSVVVAEVVGFRFCLRCWLEVVFGTFAWIGMVAIVSRVLCFIEDGALDDGKFDDLVWCFGMGEW